MYKQLFLTSLTLSAALTLAACSSSDDPEPETGSELSTNPTEDDGKGGGDTTPIAGLWDASVTEGETTDVIYWNLTEVGVLTQYDYQQDGAESATDENCYIIGDPISVSPKGEDEYSLFNVAVTAVVSDNTLTITFNEPDKNDFDNDGDKTETPTLSWTLLSTPTLEDLNDCADNEGETSDGTSDAESTGNDQDIPVNAGTGDNGSAEGPEAGVSDGESPEGEATADTDEPMDPSEPTGPVAGGDPGPDGGDSSDIPFDNSEGRPLMTRAECTMAGGSIIGDIGDGAIHKPEYRCESGEPPVARITYLEGEPISIEGEVCCL